MQLITKTALISGSFVWNSLAFCWAYNLLSSARSLTSPLRLVTAENTSKGMWCSRSWKMLSAFKLHCSFAYGACFSSNQILFHQVWFLLLCFFSCFFLCLFFFLSLFLCFLLLLFSQLYYYLLTKSF